MALKPNKKNKEVNQSQEVRKHYLEADKLMLYFTEFLMNWINFIKHMVSLSLFKIVPQLMDIILQFCVICIMGDFHLKSHQGQFLMYNILLLFLSNLYQLKLVELNRIWINFFVH
eukprot:535917_1